MNLFPAIDIRGGQAVRLTQGDYGRETVYDSDPLSAAASWVEQGAKHLHVVDLDGARDGLPANREHLERICAEFDVPVQFGGGLRSTAAVASAIAAGADQVILGTAAMNDPDLVAHCVRAYPGKTTVSLDVRSGYVAMAGWTSASTTTAFEAIDRLQSIGVRRFVYTNIESDGMLTGIDSDEIKSIGDRVSGELIASGGIGTLEHLRTLRQVDCPQLGGVIVGKALYERCFTVAEALAALDGD